LDGDDRRAKVKRAKDNENRIAKTFGGRRLPRSGGRRWSATDSTTDQGDVTSPDFLIEHKHTVKDSISLKKEWLRQVEAGARRKGKDPALVLTFETADRRDRDDYVVVPLSLFERLRSLAKAGAR
jgi:hypothetical protein